MKMAKILSYVLVSFIIVSFGNGKLLIVPEDIEAVVGSTVRFSCRTSDPYNINWDHIPVGSKSRHEVFFSGSLIGPYDERFDVKLNTSTGDYNLTIRSVEWKDSGRYECIDMAGHGERRAAELIVLARPPACQSDIGLEDLIGDNDCGIEQSSIHFQCNLRYSGNVQPRITWSASDGSKIVPKTLTIEKESDQITFTTVVSAQWNMNGLRYFCRTALSGYEWSSDTARVSYVFNTSEVKTVTAARVHRCEANTSQSCKYRWMKVTADGQQMVAYGQSLNGTDMGLYRCNAECKIQNRSCTVQPMSVNHVEERNTKDSSAEPVPLWAVIVIVVIVTSLVFLLGMLVKWWKNRQKKKTRGHVLNCPKVLETGDFLVQGMAVLRDHLYVIRRGIRTILVYQSSGKYDLIKEMQNTKLHDPKDIAACSVYDCLYITDCVERCVWRMDTNENIQLWKENINKPFTLSVNSKGQVIMGQIPNKVIIYNADETICHSFEVYATGGPLSATMRQRIRHLSNSSGKIHDIKHVVELGDGNYIISHGENTDASHEVLIVTNTGEIKKFFGHDKGPGNSQLYHPRHVAVSDKAIVFVADKANDKVVILDKQLQKLDEIGTDHNIKQPNRLCYSNGQLLIGQYRAIHVCDVTNPLRFKRVHKVSFSSDDGERDELLEGTNINSQKKEPQRSSNL